MSGLDPEVLLAAAYAAVLLGVAPSASIAAAAQLGALRLERPGEIAAVLALARTAVVVVGLATALVLANGLWLIEETGHSLGDSWIGLSLLLLVLSGVLGAIGGRKAKRARQLADAQSGEPAADPEIQALLRDPASLAANALAGLAALAILVLMVWRP